MNPLLIQPTVEVIKELFKFGGSFRKEAIGIGALTPAVVSIYNTYSASCADECNWLAVSGEQWAALVGACLVMTVHLVAKRNEAKNNEEV